MRQTVTIQAPALGARSTPRQIRLHSGESATFGLCACGECAIDLPLPGAHARWFAGEVTAAGQHWLLTNLSDTGPLIVENLENSFEYLTVEPCRCGAPVPFELARVTPAECADAPDITVFGPEPRHTKAHARRCAAAPRRRPLLDRGSTYFAVLSALCEPRMVGPVTAPLPTSAEIATLLSGRGARVTVRAVDAHVEYVTGKLGLRRGIGRDVLVATAIRHGVFG